MAEWARESCTYLVLGMGMGYVLLLLINIWWKVFDRTLKVFKCHREFIKFVRAKLANKPKICEHKWLRMQYAEEEYKCVKCGETKAS